MPKPFDGHWRFDRETIKQRPKLATHIGIIAAMWTQADDSLTYVFSQLLQSEAVVGTAMYLSLIGEKAKDSALNAAAKEKLPQNLIEQFESLIQELKPVRRKRNQVVHGFWAISDDKPDSLIFINAKKMARVTSMTIAGNMQPLSESATKFAQAIQEQAASYMEYTEVDFLQIEEEILKVMISITAFSDQLSKVFPVIPESLQKMMANAQPPKSDTGK